ncbi:MAG TPA: VWA domain-containing protein [Methylomirabilota bacterium]|nr:VWA domain-containing protein [Methylomirabilota bacterium]
MIRFSHPWALLALLLFVVVWPALRRAPRRAAIRRALGWLCLGMALGGPEVLSGGGRERVVLAVDLSASAMPALRESLPRLRSLVADLPRSTRIGLVGFGGRAYAVSPPESGTAVITWLDRLATEPGLVLPASEQDETDIAAGLEVAGWSLAEDGGGRVVLVSDGWESRGDARAAASKLAARGVAVDVVPLERRPDDVVDAAVEDIEAPAHVLRGLAFEVGATIRSTVAAPATALLVSDGTPVARRELRLSPGDQAVRFIARADLTGERRYGIRVVLEGDREPRNDVAETRLEVLGRPRVLWIGGGAPSVAAVDVHAVPPDAPGPLPRLEDFHVVVLAGVGIDALPRGSAERLREYVRSWGGGFLMTGAGSFGPGGYRGTPIEEILPVDLDPGSRRQRPGLALVVVLDKSGSMAERLGAAPKIAAARDAVLVAAGLLEAQDRFGLVAFDSRPAPLHPPAPPPGRERLAGILARVEPGGGTRILPALAEAAALLEPLAVFRRHIVLVTDGRGEGGDFAGEARRLRARGITVSAIAVGDDADGHLLQSIAAAGGGRFEPAREASRLAAAFRREVLLARGPIVHEGRITVLPSPHPVSAGIEPSRIPPLRGYVSTAPKPFAAMALRTESGEPVLALASVGLGRSAALTTDLAGPWGADWRAWPESGPLLTHLLQWLVRAPVAGTLSMSQEPSRDGWALAVRVEDADGNRLNARALTARLRSDDGSETALPLRQRGPGLYTAALPSHLARPTLVILEERSEGTARVAGRGWIGLSYPEEYRLRPVNRALLEQVRRARDGRSLEPPGSLPPIGSARPAPLALWPWLAVAALALFLLDLLPGFPRWRRIAQVPRT